MSEVPKQKELDPEALPWGVFFHKECEDMKIRTQMLQWEKAKESEAGKQEMREIIARMVLICKQPPYDAVDKKVLQRIIHIAIGDDKDFKGFSEAWIRRILKKWWEQNGDRVLMAKNQKDESVYAKVHMTKEQNEYVDTMLEYYRRSLLAQANEPVNTKDFKEPVRTNGISSNGYFDERKQFAKAKRELQQRIDRASSEYYEKHGRQGQIEKWDDDYGFYVLAETEEQAMEIYNPFADAIIEFTKPTQS